MLPFVLSFMGLLIWLMTRRAVTNRVFVFPQPAPKTLYGNIYSYVGRIKFIHDLRDKYVDMLHGAGWKHTPEEFLGFKVLCSLAGIPLFVIHPSVGVAGCVFGFFIPDLSLKQDLAKQKSLCNLAIPVCARVAGAAIGAGATIQSVISSLASLDNPLARHFKTAEEEMEVGYGAEAVLNRIPKRIGTPEVMQFIQLLLQFVLYKTDVSNKLYDLAINMMDKRVNEVETRVKSMEMVFLMIMMVTMVFPMIWSVVSPIMGSLKF